MNQTLNSFSLVLFDFGNTLANEFYFSASPAPIRKIFKEWIYDPYYLDPLGDTTLGRWMNGQWTQNNVAQFLAEKSGLSQEEILREIRWACQNVQVFPQVFALATELKQYTRTAIVTINADVFSEFIVPHLQLDQRFHQIYNSFHYQTLHKNDLCQAALKQNPQVKIEDSILIDNTKQNNIDFQNLGGNSYHFTTEQQFLRDWS